ncbi:MAG: twin-arginine translocation signal domain-containing protein, partial [Planctomycetes bacterium]|nr:twin-arginine translocation signal domain-containing protein [Planctomycetota bacterium]
MSGQPIRRRSFLRATAAGTAAVVLGQPAMARAGNAPGLKIEEPFHGAVLNRRHGKEVDGGLKIQVVGGAPLGQPVRVNGAPARREGDRFTAEVVLREKETEIVAGGAGEDRVRVVWDRQSFPRYRFSIDDNSFFLRDIAQKEYGSLFDCFYLKILQDLNARYGAKFVLNIYYTTGADFKLPQFPDRYRGEWKDNAHWLKLAFHAHANDPDRPY